MPRWLNGASIAILNWPAGVATAQSTAPGAAHIGASFALCARGESATFLPIDHPESAR